MMQNNIVVDFHAHILPECDHGSDSVEVSLKQLELAKSAGVEIVCATPHFYPDATNVEDFLKHRSACYEKLTEIFSEKIPKILLGAEVLACEGIDKMQNLEFLCLEDTNYLLLEMPFYNWSNELLGTVERLTYRKEIQIVLAHADRYDTESIEYLLNMGVKLQLNAESLSKFIINRSLLKWIKEGYVIALGSDIHGVKTGYKDFTKCQKKLGDMLSCCINPINR